MARPTKYRKEMCEEIVDAMAKGLSKEAAAVECGIHKDTLYDWCNSESKRYKRKFSDAVQEGEGKSLLFWEKMGISGAAGKLKNFKSVAWTFNMVNRHKWTMKQEISGPGGGPIVQKVVVLPDNGRKDRDVDEN